MFFCFRALSTQQGGYVRATNLYYYYYYMPTHRNRFANIINVVVYRILQGP